MHAHDPIEPTCRPGCGACCIAPSISTLYPGHPHGKPAGVPCLHLDDRMRCGLFGHPERPRVCSSLEASVEMCREDRDAALEGLAWLESATATRA